jgi:hypothetical protein
MTRNSAVNQGRNLDRTEKSYGRDSIPESKLFHTFYLCVWSSMLQLAFKTSAEAVAARCGRPPMVVQAQWLSDRNVTQSFPTHTPYCNWIRGFVCPCSSFKSGMSPNAVAQNCRWFD